jgi:hypothetical protein
VAALEFNAQWVNGVSPPSYVCNGAGVDASTKYPTWEIGYNHYHNKYEKKKAKRKLEMREFLFLPSFFIRGENKGKRSREKTEY